MADTRFLLFHKGGALFVAPPPSPFDSPATSYKLALGRGPLGFAPPLRSGFAFIAAPERQRLQMIVLAWGRPTYRPHGHFSQPMQARLYARWRFLGRELLTAVFISTEPQPCNRNDRTIQRRQQG